MQLTKEMNSPAIVMKAYQRAYKALGLTIDQGARVIGIGRSTLLRNTNGFELESKQAELQILFIRLYRSLYALFGGNVQAMQHWFMQGNKHVSGVPKELCFSVTGLVNLNAYLDALRGKV